MNTIGSLATIVLVLATIFVPQILVLYFTAPQAAESEDYECDYR